MPIILPRTRTAAGSRLEKAGKNLTETQVRELLKDGRTSTIRGFKSKTGNSFDARVTFAKEEDGKITGLKFDFQDVEPKKVEGVSWSALRRRYCAYEIRVWLRKLQ